MRCGERNLRMVYKLVIPGTLPGLNEYLQAERRRSGRYNCGNEMKQHWQAYIGSFIRKDLGRKKIEKPVRLHYTFYEPTKRRDLDNIAATAHKFIQDALVRSGVIPDDGWKYVRGFSDNFQVDKKEPRIEILIECIENAQT